MTVIIYKPNNKQNASFHTHAGDSFRETIDLWESHGLVQVEESPDPYIWFGNVGDILLYDRDTLQWLEPSLKYRVGLFGNPNASDVHVNSFKNVTWTYWGRRPGLLEDYHNKFANKGYASRTIQSVFVGKIENEVQNKYRKTHDWSTCIELFEMPYGKPGEYKYTQEEYLTLLSKSRFGLSVRGYGPKCHREVELMGMGVVPLVTDDVDVVSYHDPPLEDVHYIRVSTPSDVERVIRETTPEKWERLSKACLEWYQKNVSIRGSFNTTCEIVASNQQFRKPTSVCTICTNNCLHDLRVFLQSFYVHERNIPIVILCDDDVAQELNSQKWTSKLSLHIYSELNQYSSMNRKQMEKAGLWNEFMNLKSLTIEKATGLYKDTLMLDSDIVLLSGLPLVDTSKEIGLSPHLIKQTNVDLYGYFNGGYVYVNTNRFTTWWRKAILTSKFYDQGCLEQAPDMFTFFEFDIQDNFGWWRLLECDDPNDRARKFSASNTSIFYDSKPLRSIHTHLSNDDFHLTKKFNTFITLMAKRIPIYSYLQPVSACSNRLNVITQYYNDKNPERQKEIDYCFRYNLENEHVKRLIHFNEPATKVPDWLSSHPKFVMVACKDRLTYKQAFDYANRHGKPNEFFAITNADIFLTKESPWNDMYTHLKTDTNVIYALSRHDFDGNRLYKDPALQRLAYANSQDAWFFTTPMKYPVADCDFRIGTMGCDNAIAERFKRAGYLPMNSPNIFKIGHYDICRGKNGSNFMQDKYKKLNKDVVSPEKNGQYLLPDMDAIQSVDSLLHSLKVSNEYKYSLICDIMSKFIKVNNG